MSKKGVLGAAAVAAVLALGAGGIHARQVSQPTFTGADYFEIADLYARYTRAVDMGQCWGANEACKPYVDTFADPRRGVAFYHERIREEGWASRHTYASLLVEPTPEGANGSVYALIFNVTAVPPFVDHSVYYEDKLVRTPNGWRFKERRILNNVNFKPAMPYQGPER